MIGLWWFNSVNLPSTRLPPKEDRPATAYRRTHFGQHVLWHEYEFGSTAAAAKTNDNGGGRNLSAKTLEAYRQQGDEAFDTMLDLYAKEGRPMQAGDDLFERFQQPHDTNDKGLSEADLALKEIISCHSQVPTWVDTNILTRGQRVFLAYFPAIGMSLYYRSLVPGFSMPKIAAVLQATAYLAPPANKTAVRERLMDTGAFLGACLQSEDVAELLPGGSGWKAALRVRLLHAKVRRRLLTKSRTR